MLFMRATQAHIHLDNLRDNLIAIKKRANGKRICVPVKADAYGHGATRVAIAALKNGADFLAVASIAEGIELREAGIVAPILSLSLPTLEEIPLLIVHSITPLVFDKEFILELAKTAQNMHRTIPVHLKIDTGMGRVGCSAQDAPSIARLITQSEGLFLEGVCTHFAASDSLLQKDVEYTKKQFSLFISAVDKIKIDGINPGIVHCASSAVSLLYPQMHCDMIRPGIIVYGYFPDEDGKKSAIKDELLKQGIDINLKPVMEVITQIVSIKRVQKGSSISYGRTWTAQEDCDIATLPIGYADGIPRSLSSKLEVLVNGKKYPIVGRICMDQCMINLGTNHGVKRWDSVTVFGPQSEALSATDLAKSANTIAYEITCGINKRVPRVYLGS